MLSQTLKNESIIGCNSFKSFGLNCSQGSKNLPTKDSPPFTKVIISSTSRNIAPATAKTAAPINAISNLLELKAQTTREEKRVFRQEKREKEFPWGWLIIGLSLIPALILLLSYIF